MTKLSIKEEINNLKRQRILDAASVLFHENGYRGTSIDAIAQQVNVTKPFIYYYFKNKAEILAAVCGETTAIVAEMAEQEALNSGPAQVRLRNLVKALTLKIIKSRVYLAVYFREEKHLPPANMKALADNRRRFNLALRQLLEQGVASGEFQSRNITVATQSITGMTTWLFNWYRETGPLTPEAISDEMAGLCVAMLTNPSEG